MEPNDNADQLTISPETVFYIIVKAREFDEKVAPSDPKKRPVYWAIFLRHAFSFVESIQPSDIDGSESRNITLTLG